MKCRLADAAPRRVQQGRKRGVAQLNRFSAVVLDHAKLEVGIVQLAKHLAGRRRHFALHREQLFFRVRECMRLVAQQPLEQEVVRCKLLGGHETLHLRGRDRHDFRPDVARRLAGAAGGVLIAPLNALVSAVGSVLGRLEKRIRAKPLARAVHVDVELKARGDGLGTGAELAAELFIAPDAPLPAAKGRLPRVVIFEQRGQVPRIGRLHLSALR